MYRDPDRSELTLFAKHVQVAETMFVVNRELLEKLADRWDAETRQGYALAWVQLWEQLDFARGIAVKYGRDVSGLDAAKRRANAEARELFISRGNRDAALRAFAEVRQCMPEIVVPTEIPVTMRGDAPVASALPAWLVVVLVLLGVVLFLGMPRGC